MFVPRMCLSKPKVEHGNQNSIMSATDAQLQLIRHMLILLKYYSKL